VLPLTVKLRALQEAEEARAVYDASWLGGCDGFTVWNENGRVGTVVHPAAGDRDPVTDAPRLAVRTGMFHHRTELIAASQVDHIQPGQRQVRLKRGPSASEPASRLVDVVAVRPRTGLAS
jgi:hypothetical protein